MLATAILSAIFMGLMVGITWYYAKKTRDLWEITRISVALGYLSEILSGSYRVLEEDFKVRLSFMQETYREFLNSANRLDIEEDVRSDLIGRVQRAISEVHNHMFSVLTIMLDYKTNVMTKLADKSLHLDPDFLGMWEIEKQAFMDEIEKWNKESVEKLKKLMKELDEAMQGKK